MKLLVPSYVKTSDKIWLLISKYIDIGLKKSYWSSSSHHPHSVAVLQSQSRKREFAGMGSQSQKKDFVRVRVEKYKLDSQCCTKI